MHHSRGRPLWEVDQWLSISCLREICCRFATYVSFIFHALVQEIRYVYVVKKQHDLDLSKNPSVFPTHKSCICHSCFPLNSVFFEAPCIYLSPNKLAPQQRPENISRLKRRCLEQMKSATFANFRGFTIHSLVIYLESVWVRIFSFYQITILYVSLWYGRCRLR